MTLAFWQAGNLPAAGRAVRDWARLDRDRPAAHRFAARIYEDMGAIDLAAEAADRVAARAPDDADAWARVGRLRLRLMQRDARARRAGARARDPGPTRTRCSTSRSPTSSAATSAARFRRRAATQLAPDSAAAWARHAHALARTDRISDAIAACERALDAQPADAEVAELLERLRGAVPRVLPAA